MRPIDVEVDLCDTGGEHFLQPRLNVSLPSVERQLGKLVEVGQFRFNGGAVLRCKGFIAVFFGSLLGSFVEGFVFLVGFLLQSQSGF